MPPQSGAGQALQSAKLTVAVTGASGLVGRRLTAALEAAGHTVVRLQRPSGDKQRPLSPGSREWRPENPDPKLLEGIDVVVHLAGVPLARRFSRKHQRAIHNSRILPT